MTRDEWREFWRGFKQGPAGLIILIINGPRAWWRFMKTGLYP